VELLRGVWTVLSRIWLLTVRFVPHETLDGILDQFDGLSHCGKRERNHHSLPLLSNIADFEQRETRNVGF